MSSVTVTATSDVFLQEAREHRSRGFGIVWLQPGERMPKVAGWTERSREPEDYVPGMNLGLMTGWVSRNLVLVDLDAQEAIALAGKLLPPTGMIDGREAKPESHRWYIAADVPAELTSTAKQASRAAAAAGVHPGPRTFHFRPPGGKEAVAILGTGSLGTVPPSVVSEERRVWYGRGEPAAVPYKELHEAVCELAEACGWQPRTAKLREAADDLARVEAVSGEGGRAQTWHAARLLVNDHLLGQQDAWDLFREWNELYSDPPWSEKELYEHLERARDLPPDLRFPRGGRTLPRIQPSRTTRTETVDSAVEALRGDISLYRRGGLLVDTVPPDEPKKTPPTLRSAPFSVVAGALASAAQWTQHRVKEGKTRVVPVPDWVVKDVMARGSWPCLRFLKAVVECPVLRPDGGVLLEPGYDPDTCVLYHRLQPLRVEVPEAPTQEDAGRAAGELLAVVQDFPFVSSAHASVWLAALLTALARHAYEGPSPLFLFDANTPGTGKTLLAELVAVLAQGRFPSALTATQRDEEMRKLITTVLLAGSPLVLFDNVSGEFGTPSLDRALTSHVWGDRLLGTSTQVNLPNCATWLASSNNATLVGDMHRRTLVCRLESTLEHPEDRDDFRITEELGSYVLAHRAELLSAALTVLRAHALAGRPWSAPRWGKYEAWSRVVRGAVVWAGLPDPAGVREEQRKSCDSANAAIAKVLCGIRAMGGTVTTDQIAARSLQPEGAALKEGLLMLRAKPGDARSIGARLKGIRLRVVEGERLYYAQGAARVGLYWVGPPGCTQPPLVET